MKDSERVRAHEAGQIRRRKIWDKLGVWNAYAQNTLYKVLKKTNESPWILEKNLQLPL